jgi:enoyl-CoA hydratase
MEGSMTRTVAYDAADGIATITLQRPEARNALSAELVAEVDAALSRAEDDTAVAVIVLTGTDPAFCAGLDVKEFTATGRPPAGVTDLIERVPMLAKPTIGAINGAVMTGGLELALGLDLLIGSERARFGDTHAKVGLLPGGGMTARLPRAAGIRLALDMSFTGRVLDAEEALAHGLVSRVVAHDRLLATAQEMAAVIASRDARIVQELKQLYRVSLDSTQGQGVQHERSERDARRGRGQQLVPDAGALGR